MARTGNCIEDLKIGSHATNQWGYSEGGTTLSGGNIQSAGNLTLDGAATIGGVTIVSGGLSLGAKQTVAITSDAITAVGPVLELTAQSGTADDLTTINGGNVGDLVFIHPRSTDTITVNQTGNIRLKSSTVALSGVNAGLWLRKNSSGNWVDVTRQA